MFFGAAIPVLSLASLFGLGDTAPKPVIQPKNVDASVVFIRTPIGAGSGFLATMDGKKYIVTNQHVLMGAPAADVHITFTDGTEAHPTKPEIVGDLDLARIEIDTPRAALTCAAGAPEIGTQVVAVGNSLDAGVITAGAGRIKGVGDTEIEVDCDFVPGNSGGPIIDPAGQVLGVATYIRFGQPDATTEGTRYASNRRFAVRLHDGMNWIPVPRWDIYAATGAVIHGGQRAFEEINVAAEAISTNKSPALFKPKVPQVISAMADYGHLQDQVARLTSGPVTPQLIRDNQPAIIDSYRSAFLKLHDACSSSIQQLASSPIPKQWGWLQKQRSDTTTDLQTLQSLLDGAIKKTPTFSGE